MRRVACVFLPQVRIEVASETGCVAVIVARRRGTIESERDVLGNSRIDVVSRQAWETGVRAGHTVAAARAKCAHLKVRVVAEKAVSAALERVAEVALAFGPAAAFDVAQDVVWVDTTGCAHLHGGERELLRVLAERVRALGHVCRVVVAGGPRISAAIARFGGGAPKTNEFGSSRKRSKEEEPTVVADGKDASAIRALPVAALALDPDVTRWLRDLGLHTCGDLQRLPRPSLGTRLGERVHDTMRFLEGIDDTPLVAWRPPSIPEEKIELDWGASCESLEALTFIAKMLCDRLAARLSGRAMGATCLELDLTLDRSFARLTMAIPLPLARAGDLLAVVRARLENHSLAAPVLAATLRVPGLAPLPVRALDLLSRRAPSASADEAESLPRLVAELDAELGPCRVGTLELVDTWVLDRRTRLVPLGMVAKSHDQSEKSTNPRCGRAARRSSLVTSGLEPSRLIEPIRIAAGNLVRPRLLARTEAVQWWRSKVMSSPERSDWMSAWFAFKGGGALGWVELRGGEALLRGWLD
jgi:protein ImuB